MNDDTAFNYYYGDESEQFVFLPYSPAAHLR